jgi:hypothetical protein
MFEADQIDLDLFIAHLETMRDASKQAIKLGAMELVESPMRTLEWSGKLFEAAAKLDIVNDFLKSAIMTRDNIAAVAAGGTVESGIADSTAYFEYVRKNMQDRIVQMAKSPKRSTSVTSNLLEQERLAAYAELADQMRGCYLYGLAKTNKVS